MSLTPLPDLLLRPLVEAALREDHGDAGDITTSAVVSEGAKGCAMIKARMGGILAGMDLARLAFQTLDPAVRFTPLKLDGEPVFEEDCLAKVEGPARALLSAERVALNYLSHLSGIATETHKLVDAVRDFSTRISCTRKTTPGLRLLEKYAVRCGGGINHRFGLYDAILIKDNHIALAGGIRAALQGASQAAGHLVKVEIEIDTLAQLDEAIAAHDDFPFDAVLLDNMSPPTLKQAVDKAAGKFITEASGGVTLKTVAGIAASGVNLISVGWITHSAPTLDIGLDMN